jgi:hypothetical protein
MEYGLLESQAVNGDSEAAAAEAYAIDEVPKVEQP